METTSLRIAALLRYLPVMLLVLGMMPGAGSTADDSAASIQLQGDLSYRQGDFETGLQSWQESAALFRTAHDLQGECAVLLKSAMAEQALGRYQDASILLEEARTLAEQSGNSLLIAEVLGQLGYSYLLESRHTRAEQILALALELAQGQHALAVEAGIYYSLGRLGQLQDHPAIALEHYTRSRQLSEQTGNPLLTARTALDAAALELQADRNQQADEWLTAARQAIRDTQASHDRTYLLIRAALLQYRLAKTDTEPEQAARLTRAAYDGLRDAAGMAAVMHDARAESWAWGYLGEIYEEHGQIEDALELTRRAILAIQQHHAPELLYLWEWQKGRQLKRKGAVTGAMQAYARAITILQSIRAELAAGMERAGQSYHQQVGPLLLEYADLLLQQGDAAGDPQVAQNTLLEARNAVELLKEVELQDYFRDDCISLARSRVKGLEETLSPGTAILYPILFPERTDLLLSTGKGLSRYSIPVTAADLARESRSFRTALEKRTTRQYLKYAQQLYDWLIRPVEDELETGDIETLVIVPDAALRTIPMAALHDGREFLIQRYALASTPSLELTDPRPLQTGDATLLLNGLTEAVQGFPGLPNVDDELVTIQSMYGGSILKDSDFTVGNFRSHLEQTPYDIVHIASHGKFAGKVSDSFILAYDGKLTMNDLERYIGLSQVRVDRPVELLTLSACETAAGDDWSGLGLASVAIKAGARSALATLWYIDDRVTSSLVSSFYEQLGKPGTSKAKALQQAQIGTLENIHYQHPAYWAPFLLIGNWL